jgi:hypothetical protein
LFMLSSLRTGVSNPAASQTVRAVTRRYFSCYQSVRC